jgi:hypothetical protein
VDESEDAADAKARSKVGVYRGRRGNVGKQILGDVILPNAVVDDYRVFAEDGDLGGLTLRDIDAVARHGGLSRCESCTKAANC